MLQSICRPQRDKYGAYARPEFTQFTAEALLLQTCAPRKYTTIVVFMPQVLLMYAAKDEHCSRWTKAALDWPLNWFLEL